jgi:hypothetical protein
MMSCLIYAQIALTPLDADEACLLAKPSIVTSLKSVWYLKNARERAQWLSSSCDVFLLSHMQAHFKHREKHRGSVG